MNQKTITRKSIELFERSKKVSPGGVHSPVRAFRNVQAVPRFIDRGEGAHIFDCDGNRYVDFCMSWGPLIFGHADPDVKAAVLSQLERGWSFGTAEAYSLDLAELIRDHIPWIEKIRFVSSGTEAVMSALRVARAATKRDLILKFDGCYHGHADSMLVRAGSGLAEMASPDSAGVSTSVAAETLVAPLDDLEAIKKIFAKHGEKIAAVIVEPIPANNGLLLQTESFLKELQAIAQMNGSLLIFDEVITGFRVAFGGMAERCKIKPDLVTYGKVLGGGFPVGAFGGRADLMDLVAPSGPVYQAGTLSANPVAMKAGFAMLSKLLKTNPYAALERKTEAMAKTMENKLNSKIDAPIKVQYAASLFWLACGKSSVLQDGVQIIRRLEQIPKAQKEFFGHVYPLLLDRGYYLPPSGYEVGFLATVHTDEQIEGFIDSFVDSVETLKHEVRTLK